MTKLYAVVTGADYDGDATIHGIYTTPELAAEAMRRYGADRIEEQQADVLPELPDGKYCWAVSWISGDRFTPRHADVRFTAKSYIGARGAIIFCHAATPEEAVEIARRELPRLQREYEASVYESAVETQRRVDAGELQVVGITRDMLINDNLQPFAVGMLGSMWGRRQSTNS